MYAVRHLMLLFFYFISPKQNSQPSFGVKIEEKEK